MQKSALPRVAAIHDLSCFGRCALTVIEPTLSAMGAQVVPIPTALLSSHTGGFTGLYFRDLTEDMRKIIAHFDELGLTFDSVYSGFLGSAEQIEIVADFIRRFGEGALVAVDPVMGDDGKLYQTYTEDLVEGMRRLCSIADVITPNLTEACFLVQREMPVLPLANCAQAEELARSLCDELSRRFGTKKIVVTGLHYNKMLANACFEGGELALVETPCFPRSFPGTGDIFASVLVGALMNGMELYDAVRKAADFTCHTIALSQDSPEPSRNGVAVEKCLGKLTC